MTMINEAARVPEAAPWLRAGRAREPRGRLREASFMLDIAESDADSVGSAARTRSENLDAKP